MRVYVYISYHTHTHTHTHNLRIRELMFPPLFVTDLLTSGTRCNFLGFNYDNCDMKEIYLMKLRNRVCLRDLALNQTHRRSSPRSATCYFLMDGKCQNFSFLI